MLSLANVFHFLPHKFTGLCARRFAFARVPARALDRSFLRHSGFHLRARDCARAAVCVRPFPPLAGILAPLSDWAEARSCASASSQ
jgi:hypothetical protein